MNDGSGARMRHAADDVARAQSVVALLERELAEAQATVVTKTHQLADAMVSLADAAKVKAQVDRDERRAAA